MALYAPRRAGLDGLAARAEIATADYVRPGAPVGYLLVHYALVLDQRPVAGDGDPPRRDPAMLHAFWDRLVDVLTAHGRGPPHGGFKLHEKEWTYGVWAHPFHGNVEDGSADARALWNNLREAGILDLEDGRQVEWRRGDVLYVHFPEPGGMTFAGAVIQTAGVAPPPW